MGPGDELGAVEAAFGRVAGEPGLPRAARRALVGRREQAILGEILRALGLLPGVVAWRVNVGAMRVEGPRGRRFVRFGLPGMADILGWRSIACPGEHERACRVCGGRGRLAILLAVEVKRPGERPTAAQAAFLDRVREAGGLAVVATSVGDVLGALGLGGGRVG